MPQNIINAGLIQAIIDFVVADGGTRKDVVEVSKIPRFVQKIGETGIEERDELRITISFVLPENYSLDGFEKMSLFSDPEIYHCGRSVSISLNREDLAYYFDVGIITDLLRNINSYSRAGARAFDFLCSHEDMISVDFRKFTWIFLGTCFVCACGRIAMRVFYFNKILYKTIVHDNDQLNIVRPLHRIAIFTDVVSP